MKPDEDGRPLSEYSVRDLLRLVADAGQRCDGRKCEVSSRWQALFGGGLVETYTPEACQGEGEGGGCQPCDVYLYGSCMGVRLTEKGQARLVELELELEPDPGVPTTGFWQVKPGMIIRFIDPVSVEIDFNATWAPDTFLGSHPLVDANTGPKKR